MICDDSSVQTAPQVQYSGCHDLFEVVNIPISSYFVLNFNLSMLFSIIIIIIIIINYRETQKVCWEFYVLVL